MWVIDSRTTARYLLYHSMSLYSASLWVKVNGWNKNVDQNK